MSDPSASEIESLRGLSERYQIARGRSGESSFLGGGGSAVVFKVNGDHGNELALKVYRSGFLDGDSGPAERRRLNLQKSLIGHSCNYLIQTIDVVEENETAFVEMELLDWPQLTAVLEDVPDSEVANLFNQLLDAVLFLKSKSIVHRDIKPDNIHVSSDFKQLKLLDLGVARSTHNGSEDEAVTDHGSKRPFLATAQYSSPEYLFRLDEPSDRLWDALNIYQLGAVLHDLIMKKPIFADEVSLGNRWLVAKAVLTTPPNFNESTLNRLALLKALSARCLVKKIENRLRLVDLESMKIDESSAFGENLRQNILRSTVGNSLNGEVKANAALLRAKENREEIILTELQSWMNKQCTPKFSVVLERSGKLPWHRLMVYTSNGLVVCSDIIFSWGVEHSEEEAEISILIAIIYEERTNECLAGNPRLVGVTQLSSGIEMVCHDICKNIAKAIMNGLAMMETCEEISELADQILLGRDIDRSVQ